MKRLLALTALISSIYSLDKFDFTPKSVSSPNMCCNNYKSSNFMLYYNTDGRMYFMDYIGDFEEFDIDCDGHTDWLQLTRYDEHGASNPIMYSIKNYKDDMSIVSYYDPLEDGLNGNEIKCVDLQDCLEKAIIDKRDRIDTWLTGLKKAKVA